MKKKESDLESLTQAVRSLASASAELCTPRHTSSEDAAALLRDDDQHQVPLLGV